MPNFVKQFSVVTFVGVTTASCVILGEHFGIAGSQSTLPAVLVAAAIANLYIIREERKAIALSAIQQLEVKALWVPSLVMRINRPESAIAACTIILAAGLAFIPTPAGVTANSTFAGIIVIQSSCLVPSKVTSQIKIGSLRREV